MKNFTRKGRGHWHALLCVLLNSLSVSATIVMIILDRPCVGERHVVCSFGCSELHMLNDDGCDVLLSGDVDGYVDDYIFVDNGTNMVWSVTKEYVTVEFLAKLESIGACEDKRRLFCFAHQALSNEALLGVLCRLQSSLKCTEIYLAGISPFSCKSLYGAILGECPLGVKCVEMRLRCIEWEEWKTGSGKVKKMMCVWPKYFILDYLE